MPSVSERRGHSADDYLEAVYFLVFPVGAYRPADAATPIAARVADMLGVSRAAVGEALQRLTVEGLIERMPNRWIALTPTGVERAEHAVRRRRIVECFLAEYLGYDPAAAHDRSGELASGFDQDLIDRIYERLGSPERSPHGWPIAPVVERAENAELSVLAEVEPGEQCEIVRMAPQDSELASWLFDEGLRPGVCLKVEEVASAADQLRVRLNGESSDELRVMAAKAARSLFVRRVG